MTQPLKNPSAVWETWVLSLGWEDPLEKGKAAHSSILAWRVLWIIWSVGRKDSAMTERLSLSLSESYTEAREGGRAEGL